MRLDADPAVSGAQEFWQLPDEEFDRLLALTGQADSVELKFIVPERAHGEVRRALGIDGGQGRSRARRVYFLDTLDLALHQHGVVARVRSIDRRPDDSVIKLRPLVPDDLPAGLRRSGRFLVEVDGMPGDYVCSGAMKAHLGMHDVQRVMAQGRPLRGLFSPSQQALLAAHAPSRIDIDDLEVFGPVEARRWKIHQDGVAHPLVVERWRYPDGSQLLEVSIRCPADKALQVAAQTAATMRAHHIDLTAPQQTKTSLTLDFFARQGPAT
jgi:hypothetical protein